MGFGVSIVLIACGILGASAAIVKKRPDAKELIDKLATYQGWIGFVACLWGLWITLWSLLNMGTLMDISVILWITILASGVLCFALGLLLGFGLITKYALSKNEAARQRGEQLRAKLAPYQVTLGWAGIGVGLWSLIENIIVI